MKFFFYYSVDTSVVAIVPVVAIFIIIHFQSFCFLVFVLILR